MADSLSSEGNERRMSSPDLIAKTIVKSVRARRHKTRYAVGFGAKPMIFLHDTLPNRTLDAFMRRATGA